MPSSIALSLIWVKLVSTLNNSQGFAHCCQFEELDQLEDPSNFLPSAFEKRNQQTMSLYS